MAYTTKAIFTLLQPFIIPNKNYKKENKDKNKNKKDTAPLYPNNFENNKYRKKESSFIL